jgi:hypothetical protein
MQNPRSISPSALGECKLCCIQKELNSQEKLMDESNKKLKPFLDNSYQHSIKIANSYDVTCQTFVELHELPNANQQKECRDVETKRKQIAAACIACRQSKKKCNGALPCSRCYEQRTGASCVYTLPSERPDGLLQFRLSSAQGLAIAAARTGPAAPAPLCEMGWRQSDLYHWFGSLPLAIQALLASAAHNRTAHGIAGDPSPPGPHCADAAGDLPSPPPQDGIVSVNRHSAAAAAAASVEIGPGSGPGGGDAEGVGRLEVHYDHGLAPRTVLANARLAALLGIDTGEL